MHYVYVLLSEKDKEFYIGHTGDLRKRIARHKGGFVKATSYRLPVKLIYYEAYLFGEDAKRREKFLKGGKGRAEFKVQLEACLEKVKYKYR